ncbi:MAG: cyclic nucleotide-binding domain-containing protein, partial [Bacteroidetes bacterium]|nr:cyclic nucleotide-binding domain-containing protein [Bacteroidota bacterium]
MAEKSKLWYLENFNLFKGLNSEKLESLGKISKMKDFEKNQPIYFAHEPSSSIFFLKKGRVKLTRTSNDGKEMILGLVNPGEVFGEMSFLDEGERTDFAIAMEPSLICTINKEEFKKFVSENNEL